MSSYSPLNSSQSLENDRDMYFEIADYLAFDEGDFVEEERSPPPSPPRQQSLVLLPQSAAAVDCSKSRSGREKSTRGCSIKVAFKTKSDVEVLEDGYKWRKYGKKAVKNSPNPRNYYRCSSEGCSVKKRIEREREDSHYVITTYEGVHNHHAPLPATSSDTQKSY
ncbi:probable WRKY transcription factor 51 isoform X2 [Typha angustifolia]|uniref:probable WRKY transcription factor 51 isoform X2 n=1 Tax=Typha angustifolia TaxID=59011 RepID=UPI003C2AD9D9